MTDYRPRLSIEIDTEDKRKLQKLLPHGTQKMVFNVLVKQLILLMETHGSGVVIGAVIERDIRLKELLGIE